MRKKSKDDQLKHVKAVFKQISIFRQCSRFVEMKYTQIKLDNMTNNIFIDLLLTSISHHPSILKVIKIINFCDFCEKMQCDQCDVRNEMCQESQQCSAHRYEALAHFLAMMTEIMFEAAPTPPNTRMCLHFSVFTAK